MGHCFWDIHFNIYIFFIYFYFGLQEGPVSAISLCIYGVRNSDILKLHLYSSVLCLRTTLNLQVGPKPTKFWGLYRFCTVKNIRLSLGTLWGSPED